MNTSHLSSEDLDLLHLSALDSHAAEAAQSHLQGCADCRAQWDALLKDQQTFRQFVLPRTLSAVVERGTAPRLWQKFRRSWLWGVPLAASAVLLAIVASQVKPPPELAMRGGARVEVMALRGAEQFRPGPEAPLLPGDQLRFSLDGAGARHVAILARDGNGEVSVYHPYRGTRSAPLAPGYQPLPTSLALDASPGPETWVVVFSDRPLDLAPLVDAVQSRLEPRSVAGVGEVVTVVVPKASQ